MSSHSSAYFKFILLIFSCTSLSFAYPSLRHFILVRVMNSYLSKFLKNVTSDQIRFTGGKLVLRDVEVNPEGLDFLKVS